MARPRSKTSFTWMDQPAQTTSNKHFYSEDAILSREQSLRTGYAREMRIGSEKYWALAQGPDSLAAIAAKGSRP